MTPFDVIPLHLSSLSTMSISSSGVKLAESFAERGVLGAANMLWVDHFVNERYDEAQKIFDKFLRNQDIVLFRCVDINVTCV